MQPKPSNAKWRRGVAINGAELHLVPKGFKDSELVQGFGHASDPTASIGWEKQNGHAVCSAEGKSSMLVNLETAEVTALDAGAQFCGRGLVWLDAPTKVQFGLPEAKTYTVRAEKLGLAGLENDVVVDTTAESFAVRSTVERGGFTLVQYRDRQNRERPRADVCLEDSHLVSVTFARALTVRPEGGHLQYYSWNFYQNTHEKIGGLHPTNGAEPLLMGQSSFYHHTVRPDGCLAMERVNYPKNENSRLTPLRATLGDEPLRTPIEVRVSNCFFEDYDQDGQKALFLQVSSQGTPEQVSGGVVTSRARADESRDVVVWNTETGIEWRGLEASDLRSISCSVNNDQWHIVGSSHVVINHHDHLEFVSLV